MCRSLLGIIYTDTHNSMSAKKHHMALYVRNIYHDLNGASVLKMVYELNFK
jgi:hypothetical protein